MENHIVTIKRDEDNIVKLHLFGGTVMSWICSGKERLYLSPLSKLDGSKAIRGGIPLVFPNFGPWSNGPQHGFARISWWKIKQNVTKTASGDVAMVLELVDDEKTREMWNFSFNLTYTVTVGQGHLTTQLDIKNTGETAFDFTALLHTYIKVPNITNITINGFDGCLYDDKVSKATNVAETRTDVSINDNVDRVYKNCGLQSSHVLSLPDGKVIIEKSNLPDTVLWNPWSEKAEAMSDFANDGYKEMVCVEPGYVAQRKILHSDEVFSCSQTLRVS